MKYFSLFLLCALQIFAQTESDSLAKLQATTVGKKAKINLNYLRSVEGAALYEAKKTDLVVLDQEDANKATNNARQIFAKVPGITVWESDGGGIQMGIGSRGLSPSRSAEFNMRQNGYDMSADALGYPESYYTPPMESVERIEIVRGAASLQYGTQFGGMVNFVSKFPKPGEGLQVESRQTLGSFGLFNSFNRVSTDLGAGALSAYVHYKMGDDFRNYAEFTQKGGQFYAVYPFGNWTHSLEFTHMDYLAQQPGGLTDAQFQADPFQALRKRNWFAVDWNLFAYKITYQPNFQQLLDVRSFGLLASRYSLGNLQPPNRADANLERDLLKDDYKNAGLEARHLIRYSLFDASGAYLYGIRLYRGNLERKQGLGSAAADADFEYLNQENLEGSDYEFPSLNGSFFTEAIVPISENLKFTPGLRVEWIRTEGEGYYTHKTSHPLTGEVLQEEKKYEALERDRFFVLGGMGAAYWLGSWAEFYSNFSQNYRAINFNDLRVTSPHVRIDPNLQDESGFTVDIGMRGRVHRFLKYDLSGFLLSYNGRIGQVLKSDTLTLLNYRYRTNIADSRHLGMETFAEFDFWKFFERETESQLSFFTNFSYLQARYLNAQESAVEGKRVELVPEMQWKMGLQCRVESISGTLLYSYTGEQFTEATNAEFTANGVNGILPSYQTWDFSMKYSFDLYSIEAGVNNFTDEIYYSRRSTGYPGPGIITAPPRSYYLGFSLKI